MAKNLDHFRLSVSDPWEVVAGAREQRGAIVARWCVALLAFLWIRRPRADVVQQRRIPADLAARAAVPGTSETAGQQGAGI